MIDHCQICRRKLLTHSSKIKCNLCSKYCHVKCLPLFTDDDFNYAKNPDNLWYCTQCNSDIFPFNNCDDVIFNDLILDKKGIMSFNCLEENLFSPIELEDFSDSVFINDADPDANYFIQNCNGSLKQSKYYSLDKLIDEISTSQLYKLIQFSMTHLNIRSSNKNLDTFTNYLSTLPFEFSVIGLSETWLTSNNADIINLAGYNHVYKTRVGKIGGGVSIYVKENIAFQLRDDLSDVNENYECIFIEINKDVVHTKKNVVMGVVYRMPNTDISIFNSGYKTIMKKINKEKKLAYIMGDYNINILNHKTHKPTSDFIDDSFSQSFAPLINCPTRSTPTSATLIDNIFTNNIHDKNCSKGVFITDITDHFPIFHIEFLNEPVATQKRIFKRFHNNSNMAKFRNLLIDSDINGVLTMNDTQSSMTYFHGKVVSAYNKAFPLTEVKLNYKNRKPWLTKALKTSIRKKNKMFIRYRKFNNINILNDYKLYKSKLNKLIIEAERDYYLDKFNMHKNNLKKTWSLLNSVINAKKQSIPQTVFHHNNNTISNPTEIANGFNNFFANIGKSLASKIDSVPLSPLSFMKSKNPNSLFLVPTDLNEVQSVINKLKPNSSGYDHLSAQFISSNSDLILPLLVHIINTSFTTGIFPNELKVANVIPLFKSGSNSIFTNYRPISLLSTISKIFEKLFYSRLLDFLNKYNILYEFQFGFRKKRSTQMALLILVDKIINALENDEFAVGIFLDFSKAFDTVDHTILLNKLDHYGVRGNSLSWLKSYLCNREQFTTFQGTQSDRQSVLCGVPQGSILGPLLFLIYVNDLAYVSNKLFTLMFADDTSTFITGKNFTLLCKTLNEELSKIVLWLKSNKLSLNVDKTHYMVFQPKRNAILNENNISIDGKTIVQVHSCKFLGVILDDKLTWSNHILYTKNKIAKVIGILYKSKNKLCHKHLIVLYNSLLLPYFQYCNLIWSSASQTHLQPLVKIQKRAIRTICNLPKFATTQNLFHSLNILKIDDLRFYNTSIFMYNFYHKALPTMFNNFFTLNSQIHTHVTRQNRHFHTHQFKSLMSKNFIKYNGVIVWTKILHCNRTDPSCKLFVFKKNLKVYLLNPV